MTRIAFLIVVGLSSGRILAVQVPDTLNAILENNPDKCLHSVGLNYNLSFAAYNTTVFSFGLSYLYYSPRLSLSATANYNVWDRLGYDDDMTVSSIYKPDPSRHFSVVATFNFISFQREQKVPVVIWSKRGHTVTYYRKVDVNANVAHRIGLDGGLRLGTTYYFMDDMIYTVSDNNGSYQVGGNFPTLNEESSTFFNYAVVRVGLSYTNSTQVKINSENGIKKTEGITQFYSHVLMPAYQNVDSVACKDYDPVTFQEFRRPLGIQEFQFRETGFAVGLITQGLNKFNLSFSAEFGMLPGPKQNFMSDTYLDFTFRFNLLKIAKE
jgi:hypothetical protein